MREGGREGGREGRKEGRKEGSHSLTVQFEACYCEYKLVMKQVCVYLIR